MDNTKLDNIRNIVREKQLAKEACASSSAAAAKREAELQRKEALAKKKLKEETDESVKYYSGQDRNPKTGFPKAIKSEPRRRSEKKATGVDYKLMHNSYDPTLVEAPNQNRYRQHVATGGKDVSGGLAKRDPNQTSVQKSNDKGSALAKNPVRPPNSPQTERIPKGGALSTQVKPRKDGIKNYGKKKSYVKFMKGAKAAGGVAGKVAVVAGQVAKVAAKTAASSIGGLNQGYGKSSWDR